MVVVKSFATPMVWVLLLLALGLVLSRKGQRRAPTGETEPVGTRKRLFAVGRLLLLTGTVLLLALSLSPVANSLTYPLESQYQSPPAQALDRLDVVVVLGGGIHPSGDLRQEAELSKLAYPRFYHGVRVFQQNHANLLAFCGGPDREGGEETEAGTMRAMALSLGVPQERIVAEETSRTTFENIANLARLLPAGQGRRIGIVTTAIHMRRSCGVFQKQFPADTIIPIPVYYTYDPASSFLGNFVPTSGNLDKSSVALHEWIGLVWYRLRGR